MRRALILLAAFCLVSAPAICLAQADLGTSTAAGATENPQRKSFYDTVHKRHWQFFYNGAAIAYSFSSDALNWTAAGTLALNTRNYAIAYKEISGAGYVFLVAEDNYDVVLVRGTTHSGGAINFGAPVGVFDGANAADAYYKPTVALDASNYVWVAALHDIGAEHGTRYQPQAKRSTQAGTGVLSSWHPASNAGRMLQTKADLVLLPQTDVNMFLLLNGDGANIVAYRFNGASWANANAGGDYSWFTFPGFITGYVDTITVSGSDIYVGGEFVDGGAAGDIDYIAHWDGTAWQAMPGMTGGVKAIAVSGSTVYAGGAFLNAGGNAQADRIARWSGTSWQPLTSGTDDQVRALAFVSGTLYVGGDFTAAGGVLNTAGIAAWNGSNWQALGTGLVGGSARTIVAVGSDIYVGGSFTSAGGALNTAKIARYHSGAWSALGAGLSSTVYALAVSGSSLYAAGCFLNAGGHPTADYLARWDISGASWSAVPNSLLDSCPTAMAVVNDNLYIGGPFTTAGGLGPNGRYLVRHNITGASWHKVGEGVNSWVNALASFGNTLYLGGQFGADHLPAFFASWDGSSFHGIGASDFPYIVSSMLVHNGRLYVTGAFGHLQGNPNANYIASWDGSTWSSLGTGLSFEGKAMAASGNDLYVAGNFSSAGGVPNTSGIARWDGSQWHALGNGLPPNVFALALYDNKVYAGGAFENAAGIAEADYVAYWDGANWNAMDTGPGDTVYALASAPEGVYVGGAFWDALGLDGGDYLLLWRPSTSMWETVGGGLTGYVFALVYRDGLLYAGGQFTNAGGNTNADRIAIWNGSSWAALGSGIADGQVNSVAVDSYTDEVYVGGTFSQAGGVPGTRAVAKWDGAAWHALDDGLMYLVESLALFEGELYAGGNLSALGDSSLTTRNLAKWGRAVVSDSSLNKVVSALSDSSGNIHLLYTNEDNRLYYRQYAQNLNSWRTPSLIRDSTDITGAALSSNSADSVLYAFWLEGSYIRYKAARSPYNDSSWPATATILLGEGNEHYLSVEPQLGYAGIVFTWTDGSASPYHVQSYSLPLNFDLTGTVTHLGSGLAGVAVSDPSLGSAVTNAHGAFSFTNLPAMTTYTLTPSLSPYAFTPASSAGTLAGSTAIAFTALSTRDTDGDGTINDLDADDDNDGLTDAQEEQHGTDPLVADTDSDSVQDGQEVADGSDPLDHGSVMPVLPQTVCSEWNGFLGGMWNIMEHVNMSSAPRNITTDLYSLEGQASGSESFTVAPGAQFDLLVHGMQGWIGNSYGKVCSTLNGGSAGDLDGRMVYYKPRGSSITEFQFAFAMPFLAPTKGSQMVPFNTYQPSLDPADTGNLAANWIQVTNMESSAQNGVLHFHGQDGAEIGTIPVALSAGARKDFSAHSYGPNKVGLVRWEPDDSNAGFQLRNVRYMYDNAGAVNSFDAAFQLEGLKGSGRELVVPLQTVEGSSILELANALNETVQVNVKIYNGAGVLVQTFDEVLAAYATKHLIMDYVLPAADGSAVIRGSVPESVIATVMQYGRTPSAGMTYMYGLQAKEAAGTALRGSYNTFLNQDCKLLMVNGTASTLPVTVSMVRYDQTVVLAGAQVEIPARGMTVYDLSEAPDNYGVVTVQPSAPNSLAAIVVRRGSNLRIPTPVRE